MLRQSAILMLAAMSSSCVTTAIKDIPELPCSFGIGIGSVDPTDPGWVTSETETNSYWDKSVTARQVKVSIYNFETNGDLLLDQGISGQLRDKIVGVVSASGAGIVDRNLSARLQSEIIAFERNQGPFPAARGSSIDFALVGSINNPSYLAESGTIGLTDLPSIVSKGQEAKKGDPICRYRSAVTGQLKLYRIATREVIKAWPLEGKSSNYEINPRSSSCESTTQKEELLRIAANDAVSRVQDAPLEWLRPVGYILERKKNEAGKSIFRTSLGSGSGVMSAKAVAIRQKYPFADPALGRTVIDERLILPKISVLRDHINDRYSWIQVKDISKADAIQIGDTVEMVGSCS